MSVATALAALYDQYVADAANITDTQTELDANLAIERWYAVAQKHATEEASAILSYSTAGRSVSRRPLEELSRQMNDLRREVEQLLYGRGSILMDLRNDYTFNGLPT